RFAPTSVAWKRLATLRFALDRFAMLSFAFDRSATDRLAPERFALVKFWLERFAPWKSQPAKLASGCGYPQPPPPMLVQSDVFDVGPAKPPSTKRTNVPPLSVTTSPMKYRTFGFSAPLNRIDCDGHLSVASPAAQVWFACASMTRRTPLLEPLVG